MYTQTHCGGCLCRVQERNTIVRTDEKNFIYISTCYLKWGEYCFWMVGMWTFIIYSFWLFFEFFHLQYTSSGAQPQAPSNTGWKTGGARHTENSIKPTFIHDSNGVQSKC